MSIGIKVRTQPDGSLLFQASNEMRADLAALLREKNRGAAEDDAVEMIRGWYVAKFATNRAGYTLEWLHPEDVYALTEMPMFADNCRDDDDATRVYGPIWGFPDYCIRDWIAELAYKGRVVFTQVDDCGDGLTFPSRWRDKSAERIAAEAYEHCNDGGRVVEQVPDVHGEPGQTIGRVVGFASRLSPS